MHGTPGLLNTVERVCRPIGSGLPLSYFPLMFLMHPRPQRRHWYKRICHLPLPQNDEHVMVHVMVCCVLILPMVVFQSIAEVDSVCAFPVRFPSRTMTSQEAIIFCTRRRMPLACYLSDFCHASVSGVRPSRLLRVNRQLRDFTF